MDNALGEPQTIVLFGGTSDIGRAIVEALVSPATTTVVLAVRRPDDVDATSLRQREVTVDIVPFEATATTEHAGLVERLAADQATSTSPSSPSASSATRRCSPRTRWPPLPSSTSTSPAR
jgi:NAD(P)-dependent dehydrogenase (short-subunit alcohol dehydrogenase family)